MKEICPNYYEQFQCIADRCRHSCCVGWEIEVDAETLAKYQKYPWIFKNIQDGAMVLDERERCPFLNERGLCNIITELGEDRLCQICADHPRFRNFYSDRIEIGLGLCCEAAAELILSYPHPMLLPEIKSADRQEEAFFASRKQIFEILQNRREPIEERVERLLAWADLALPNKMFAEWRELYRSLERLDPQWETLLNSLAEEKEPPRDDLAFEQLLVYFVYRHLAGALEDGRFSARLLFAVLSYRMLRALLASHPQCSLAELARMYSSEVEYSEENMETLLCVLEG